MYDARKYFLYRNRKNLNYCKEIGISITRPALGRLKKNKTRADSIFYFPYFEI